MSQDDSAFHEATEMMRQHNPTPVDSHGTSNFFRQGLGLEALELLNPRHSKVKYGRARPISP